MGDKVKEAKETVAVEQNPCAKALKESWAEAEESINLLMESSEECHAEVGKQIVDSKGGSVNSYVRVDEEEGHSTVSVSKFISCEVGNFCHGVLALLGVSFLWSEGQLLGPQLLL